MRLAPTRRPDKAPLPPTNCSQSLTRHPKTQQPEFLPFPAAHRRPTRPQEPKVHIVHKEQKFTPPGGRQSGGRQSGSWPTASYHSGSSNPARQERRSSRLASQWSANRYSGVTSNIGPHAPPTITEKDRGPLVTPLPLGLCPAGRQLPATNLPPTIKKKDRGPLVTPLPAPTSNQTH